MLYEIYYYGQIDMKTQQAVIDKIECCSTNLPNCKSLSEILNDSKILTIDELKECSINGHKVFVKIDALYQKANGDYIVVDWKTGKGSAEEVEQILLYVFYVHKTFRIPVDSIEARLEYLVSGDIASYRFSNQDMICAERIIEDDIVKMRKYLIDGNKNVPFPEVYFTTNKSSRCKYCNYQELCFSSSELQNNSLAVNC
jgi:hypothetical protein